MVVINIDEAKTHLSRLFGNAIKAEPFVIAKAGHPLVKVEALAALGRSRRTGRLVGQIAVPITGAHPAPVDVLPMFHNAPFGRMLVAEAIALDLTLIASDLLLARDPGSIRRVCHTRTP